MDIKEIVQDYVQTNLKIKGLKEKLDGLKQQLLEHGEKEYVYDMYAIKRSTRKTPVVKEGIDEDILLSEFPQASKLDMKVLRKIPEAHEYLELQETPTLTVREIKETF